MLEHKDFPINSIWSICKSWINNTVYNNRNKSSTLVPNPSAMINSVHFLLGAMLPCSNHFCTSGLGVPNSHLSNQVNNSTNYWGHWQTNFSLYLIRSFSNLLHETFRGVFAKKGSLIQQPNFCHSQIFCSTA